MAGESYSDCYTFFVILVLYVKLNINLKILKMLEFMDKRTYPCFSAFCISTQLACLYWEAVEVPLSHLSNSASPASPFSTNNIISTAIRLNGGSV